MTEQIEFNSDPIDCVALMLLENDRILLERRKASKRVLPGALAIPGGHLEANEAPLEALHREAMEEFGIVPEAPRFVCSLLHRSQEFRRLDYFAVTAWTGRLRVQEAEAIAWLPLADPGSLDLEVDRLAIREYLRVYRC